MAAAQLEPLALFASCCAVVEAGRAKMESVSNTSGRQKQCREGFRHYELYFLVWHPHLPQYCPLGQRLWSQTIHVGPSLPEYPPPWLPGPRAP